jgi:hypothetical protein
VVVTLATVVVVAVVVVVEMVQHMTRGVHGNSESADDFEHSSTLHAHFAF